MGGKIVISGATGFIGQTLSELLLKNGYTVIALSRNPKSHEQLNREGIRMVQWDSEHLDGWADEIDGATAVINLAGENLSSGLWTEKRKKKLYESRIHITKALVAAVEQAGNKPEVMIQASAIGYYGNRGDEILDEETDSGNGFLADLCRDWEGTALKVKDYGVRLVRVRFGLVLGAGGPLMRRLTLPYRFFMGLHFGRRNQWVSWIHRQDVIHAILFAIENDFVHGPVNVTSPEPVILYSFMKELGRIMNRPSWLYIPPAPVKLLLGEMARQTLFSSQRVIPHRLQEWNYEYRYEKLNEALQEVLKS